MPFTNGGTDYLLTATAGAGAWKREITASTIVPTSVSISGCISTDLAIAATRSLSATVLPSNASNTSVTWSSSNSSVATVSSSGLVTAVAAGTATITVTTVSGGKTANCAVTVASASSGGGSTSPVGDCSATSSGGKPNPPCQFYAEVVNNTTAKLVWVDNSTNETEFEIQKYLEGDQWRGAGTSAVNTVTIDRAGLTTDAKYKFRIKSKNASGASAWVEMTDWLDLSGSTTPPVVTYRYLRLTGLGTTGLDVTIQQIHWMVGSNSYPNPKLVSATQSQATSSTSGGNDYKAFDDTNGGWFVASTFPAWITIDLGAGNEITPDAIMIKGNASNRAFSSFECHGSNNNSTWTLLHSRTGLTTSDYPSTYGTFSFGSGSRQATISPLVAASVSMYPSQLQAGQELTIDASELAQFSMQVVGLDGRVVFQKQFTSVESVMKLRINELTAKGIYLVRFDNGQQQWVQKILVK